MAKYRLTAPHYREDRILEAGTEVGDGTDFPFPEPPTLQMEGIDEEGKKRCEAVQEAFGQLADPIFTPPFTQPEDRVDTPKVPISKK